MIREIRSNPHWRAIHLDSPKAIRHAAEWTGGFVIKDGNRLAGVAFANAHESHYRRAWLADADWVVFDGLTFTKMTDWEFLTRWEISE